MSNFFICPNCGAEIPVKSKSCPQCGSDDQTGWSEFTYMDTISTPDENEYLDILNNEFSENKSSNKSWVVTTGILLLLLVIILVLKGLF
jgi:RNA polymerase subunit RPABC4/transcription elongation factor Spt4